MEVIELSAAMVVVKVSVEVAKVSAEAETERGAEESGRIGIGGWVAKARRVSIAGRITAIIAAIAGIAAVGSHRIARRRLVRRAPGQHESARQRGDEADHGEAADHRDAMARAAAATIAAAIPENTSAA
jgi:hypothetical protein